MSEFNDIIEGLKQQAWDSWKGEEGLRRAEELEKFLREKVAHYAVWFELPPLGILKAWEGRRNYSAINYYQESNFPQLDNVAVWVNGEALKQAVGDKGFRCPNCGGVSTDPYECNSGLEMDPGVTCNWKSYGLLKCLGKGYRFTVREGFLDHGGRVDEIFMPIALEEGAQREAGTS